MLRNIFRRETTIAVDPLIDAVLEAMHREGPESAEYPKMMTYLERLNDVKAKDSQDPVSRDTIVIVAGNLLIVLLMMAYENKHVMSRSAIGQLIRPRVPGHQQT